MKVYEKPNAVLVSFESERIMDDETDIGTGFSAVDEGLIDLGSL